MKRVSACLLAGMICSVVAAEAVRAEDQPWCRLFSCSNQKETRPDRNADEPNLLERMDRGTKKFFQGVGDAITLKPLREERRPPQPRMHWMDQKPEPKKRSFWDRLFGPPEPPPPPESLKDFMQMKRMDP